LGNPAEIDGDAGGVHANPRPNSRNSVNSPPVRPMAGRSSVGSGPGGTRLPTGTNTIVRAVEMEAAATLAASVFRRLRRHWMGSKDVDFSTG
jgi:hypothetical protein